MKNPPFMISRELAPGRASRTMPGRALSTMAEADMNEGSASIQDRGARGPRADSAIRG